MASNSELRNLAGRAGSFPTPTRRTFLSGAALAGGAAILSACGVSAGSGSASGAAKSLRVLSWFGPSDAQATDSWAQVGRAYHALNTGIKVSFDAEPNANYLAAETAKCSSKDLEDIAMELPGLPYAAIFPCLKTLTASDLGSLTTALSGWGGALAGTASGQYFGVPIGQTGIFYYYNKGLFARAGLNPESPPLTWAEFSHACEKLKSSGIIPIGVSGADGYTDWWMWNTWMMQYFPQPLDCVKFGNGTYKISQLKPALQYVQETYAHGWWDPQAASKKYTDVQADFIAGHVAIVCGVSSGAVNYQLWDQKMPKGSYGVFAGPVLPNGKANTPIPFSAAAVVVGVSADSSSSASALNFVKYAASAAGQTILTKGGFSFPNRTDLNVEALTGSVGAEEINKLYAAYPGITSPGTFFKGPAQAIASSSQLTSAITSNSLDPFLQQLDAAQASA